MDYFNYQDGRLYCEELLIDDLVAQYGSPIYIYSKATLVRHMQAFEQALSDTRHLICYAVKANGSLAILQLLARLGAGFDVVSQGELRRVIAAGGDPHKVVFSGVAKSYEEIKFALEQEIACLNIESEAEYEMVCKVANELGCKARVALRVNPNVDAQTLPAISTGLKNNKFGIPIEQAFELYQRAALNKNIIVSGIDCHIGSQMVSKEPILHALDKLLILYQQLEQVGIKPDHIDLGGGLGVIYDNENPPSPSEYFELVKQKIAPLGCAIYIEPGRAMVANAGVLATKVIYLKDNGHKRFCIVDAGMNDLIRPALYDSYMQIISTQQSSEGQIYDVVGPVCESDDYLGKERRLNVNVGNILVVRGAGAYGSSMSSTYNGHPLCAELLVDGQSVYVIRKAMSYEQMWQNEALLTDAD